MTDTIRNYTIYADPGHAWAEVPRRDLLLLGIEDEISRYSYESQRRDHVYLEEDSDLSRLMRAAQAHGWRVTLHENHTDNESPIRNLPSYRSRGFA